MKREFPLRIKELRILLDAPERDTKHLALLMLTTGIHPTVLSNWRDYGLTYDDKTISFDRPKKQNAEKHKKHIVQYFRPPMREKVKIGDRKRRRLRSIAYWKGKSRQHMYNKLRQFGNAIDIDGLCPLILRRSYFTNHGRLGHGQLQIETESKTSWDTIKGHYAIGSQQAGMLSEEDMQFLKGIYGDR